MSVEDAYVNKMRTKVIKWNTEIEQLKSELENSNAKNRNNTLALIESLNEQTQKITNKLSGLEKSNEYKREDIKIEIESASVQIEQTLEDTLEKLQLN